MSDYTDAEILRFSALEQARAVREGDLSAVRLAELYLSRISEHNETLRAFVSVQGSRALREARRADHMRARVSASELPMFHGVPIGIKDLVPTRWSPTRLGSRAYRYYISPSDGLVAKRISAGGLISLGKLATSEFGVMPVTEPEIHPPTRNPWDTQRTSGGSSGGSSAAVAADLLPIAHGSDGGGSVRIPSALTHLYGFKCSVSLLGNLHGGYNPLGISVMGPLARYVEDAAALLDVMAGRPQQDSGADSCLAATRRRPTPQRIRLINDTPIGEVDPEILSGVREVAEMLRSLGHTVEEGPAPQVDIEEFLPIWGFAISRVKTLSERLVQPVTRWVREGAVTFEVAEAKRRELAERIEGSFGGADVILSPTVPSVAPRIGAYDRFEDPGQAFREAAHLGSLTASFNLTHGPAASLPLGLTSSGLPFGVQLGARVGQDHLILSLSKQLEEALPWHNRRPSGY